MCRDLGDLDAWNAHRRDLGSDIVVLKKKMEKLLYNLFDEHPMYNLIGS